MAKWNQMVITDAGYQLSAQTLSGTKIQYTHAQTTDKDLSALTTDQLKAVTKLDSVVQDLSVGTISIQDDHTVTIPITVANRELSADYLLCGIAIFAKPLDSGDDTEILYGIATAVSPDLIPKQDGSTVVGTNFKLKLHVGRADNVNIIISPDGSVSNDELTGILKKYLTKDDLTAALPTTTIDSTKPADFKEAVTFEKGAVDGDGNAYVTQNIVESLLKAVGNGVTVLPDDTDADTIIDNGLYLVKDSSKMKHGSTSLIGNTYFYVISGGEGTDVAQFEFMTGEYDSWFEYHLRKKKSSSNSWTSWDEVARIRDVDSKINDVLGKTVQRDPNTGDVKGHTNFTNDLQVKGVPVATSDDLKSLEASAWHRLDFGSDANLGGAVLSSYIIYQIHDDEKYLSFFYLGVGQSENTVFSDNTTLMDLSSIVKGISSIDFSTRYADISDSSGQAADFKISGTKIITSTSNHSIYVNPRSTVSLYPLNHDDRRVYYTELI